MVHITSCQHSINGILVDSTGIIKRLKELVEESYELTFVESAWAVLVIVTEDLVDVKL